MNKNSKGQAAILMIFFIGMIGLLIGMTLTKTGFNESMMGRGTAGSTKAFYIANSGIEDALYKVQKAEEEGVVNIDSYDLILDEDGKASVTISPRVSNYNDEDKIETIEREITSVGTFGNYVRKIHVSVHYDIYKPDFARIIQAADAGIEIDGNVTISGRYKDGTPADVSIYSNDFVRGENNGVKSAETCETGASSWVDGYVFAVGNIEKLGHGDGPCITKGAYAKNLLNCRVYGEYYYSENMDANCELGPDAKPCDPDNDPNDICHMPEERELPEINEDLIIEQIGDNIYNHDCTIGDPDDEGSIGCYTLNADGSYTIGNIIIDGELDTVSSSNILISGPVYVTGSIEFASKNNIDIHPDMVDKSSLIMIAKERVLANSNTHFSSVGDTFLLLVSLYENEIKNEGTEDEYICEGDAKVDAVTIDSNVQGILFYAAEGCAYLRPSAGEEYHGAILAQGVKIGNNVKLVYDPDLESAEFILSGEAGWEISSFTEE